MCLHKNTKWKRNEDNTLIRGCLDCNAVLGSDTVSTGFAISNELLAGQYDPAEMRALYEELYGTGE